MSPRPRRTISDAAPARGVTVDDFHAYMPQHTYIFAPTREMWPRSSVDARIPPVPVVDENGKPVLDENGKPVRMKASTWLDRNKPVEQMIWAPGLPMLVRDRLITAGGWIERKGATCFNLYMAPTLKPGDAPPMRQGRAPARAIKRGR